MVELFGRRLNWKKAAPLAFMLVFPILGWMYHLTNRVDEEVYSLVTSLDQATPFIKYFALPYSIWIFYIYACLIYFFKKDVKLYYRGILTYTICALTCYLIYAVFQTTVPRPSLTGDDPFTWLMSYIYNRDEPFNCFPSIHCFSSYMVMRLIWASPTRNRLNAALITGMSCLIMLSTLFVKQHVILDVMAAIVLVECVLAVVVLVESVAREYRQRERQKRTYGA